MKHFLTALLTFLSIATASAQTSPNLRQGQVLTPAQWNQLFISKQDTLGYVPLNIAGGTMTGRLITGSVPNGVSAGFNLTPGSAPPSPVNGDLWMTSAGMFGQINGSTVAFVGAGSVSFAATLPITVSFPSNVVTYACATCGVTGQPLSQFAATTSAQLLGVLSDKTGTGLAVFGTAPTLTGVTITSSFTATGLVGLTNLATQATNTVLANVTAGSASPTALAVAGCTGSAAALQWVTNTGFSCATIVSAAGSIAVGTTTVTSGTSGRILYDNAGVLGEATVTGSLGSVVLSTSPTVSGLTVTGSFTATGLVTNASLATPSVTVNGTTCTLGSTCTPAGPLNVGSSVVNSGSNGFILYNNAGVLGNVATTGTGNVVLASSPTINGLTGTGTTTLANTAVTGTVTITGATTITSSSASALAVGLNGSTNPTFVVDASTASSVTGVSIKSAASGSGVALTATSSAANESLNINAKGASSVNIANISTGGIFLSNPTTISGAITYGGVTLSNSVTGTGSMVLSASPNFTGTVGVVGQMAIATSSASAFSVGLNGATNPSFQVNNATALQVAGLRVTGAATGSTVAVAVTDSGANASLSIDAKGTGAIFIGANASAGASLVVRVPMGLGNAGSAVGQAIFSNLTSGTITVQPTTGALGSAILTLPAITDTIAGVAIANGGTGGSLTASNGGIVYSDASRLQLLAGTSTAGLCLLSASNTAPTWGSCSGAAAVSSVSNSDSTLTISPTTGSVVASLNLGQANVWTAVQSFTASGIKLKGSSTGYHTFTSSNAGASNYTITVPANSMTLAAIDVASQVITGGATVTSLSQSTGNITVDCGARPLQYITNNGAYTITAPAADGSCMLLITNGASAGATTYSGFTVGTNTGDAVTTTNTSRFIMTIVRINGTSTYVVKALQ